MKKALTIMSPLNSAVTVGACLVLFIVISHVNIATAGNQIPVNKITAEAFQLWSPGKLAADPQGVIYVVDGFRNCVREFDGTGSYLGKIPVKSPSAIAVGEGKVYIGSHSEYSVSIFRSGELIGHLGAQNNEFLSIADIAIDESTGDVYVVDTKAGKVKVYYASGIPKTTFASGLHDPTAVSVADTNVIVLDSSEVPCPQATKSTGAADPAVASKCTVSRITILDKKGSLVKTIPGSDENLLNRALDVAVDRFNNVYVADTYRKAVLVFDRSGALLGAITSDLDELRFPVAVTVSSQGNILVSSSETHSIMEIGLSGELQAGTNSSLVFKSATGAPVPLSAVGY